MVEKKKKPRGQKKRSKLFPKGKERKRAPAGSCDGLRQSAAGGLRPGVGGEGDEFSGGVEFATQGELAALANATGK